jgi:transcriptional regulator with XRE-family HTH domain
MIFHKRECIVLPLPGAADDEDTMAKQRPIKPAPATDVPQPARRASRLAEALSTLRKRNSWKLADISVRTGIAISTLSKVEKNQMSLTYDKLASLSKGLGVDIAYFFSGASELPAGPVVTARRSINRAGDAHYVSTGKYEHWYPSADLFQKRLVPMIAECRARTLAEFGDLHRHTGEEYTYVLEGRIMVHTEFYAPVVLEKDESIYLDSNMGHAYLAAADGPCRVLCVTTSPETEIDELINK